MKRSLLTLCNVCWFAAAAGAAQDAVTLEDFMLAGTLSNDTASFTLTALANVPDRQGGTLELVSGAVALTEVRSDPRWRLRPEEGRFLVTFDRAGKFPLEMKFHAAVRSEGGWSAVDFRVAPATLQPVVLRGLPADTQFELPGGGRIEPAGNAFRSFLPPDGTVRLSWKATRPEAEGRLFFSAEMLSQIGVGPGLMRQTALLDFKVMQGELTRLVLIVRGAGEVTRVQGDHLLAWNIEPVTNSTDRQLIVQFNQPRKDHASLQVQVQTPLGAFPQSVEAVQLRPQAATRFAGCLRVVNEGAVRLEAAQAAGLSQISPEQFPETDLSRALLPPGGSQRFVYRFSGGDYGLRIQADQILPELGVSEVLSYRLGENELAVDGEFELDIREAPLRELLVRVPKGYGLAKLTAAGLTDYFLRDPEDQPDSELRVVFGQPVSGRLLVQLRLERNKSLGETNWALPRLEVVKAKSVRGHVAVAAEAGFRLSAERTSGLTEIATAFFPRKVPGIQTAYRLNDAAWQGVFRVERLPQTLQADALHLFSIGEGIAYGSSVINYTVSGAPVSSFRVELSDEYFNVEFTGKDTRNWQKIPGGYLVQLHTPVSGAYTLLATYERPFKAQGETLAFTGARPVDAQSEQGLTLITSAYQFQVKPEDVSAGLLALETGEVPAEYRLFFDAPILAAYRYAARPFNLRLALSPLAQGDSLSQVVDRASITTRISKEGQVLTDAHYFLKNRGNPHFRLSLPPDTKLWSASVDGVSVVPVIDGADNLIPLPHAMDPNAVLRLELKLASPAKDARRLTIAAPVVRAPVMLAEWRLDPDTAQRLVYQGGSLTPVSGVRDASGFAQLAALFTRSDPAKSWGCALLAFVLVAGAAVFWRRALEVNGTKAAARRGFAVAGGLAFCVGLACLVNLANLAGQYRAAQARGLDFLAPVQQAGSALRVVVENLPEQWTAWEALGYAWPVVAALLVWAWTWVAATGPARLWGGVLAWTLLAWAALRAPNGAAAFFGVMGASLVLQLAVPALRQAWRLPWRTEPGTPPETAAAAGSISGLLLLPLLLTLGCRAVGSEVKFADPPALAASVNQELRAEEKFAFATARVHWDAQRGQSLPLLFEPAVLTGLTYPSNSLQLVRGASAGTTNGARGLRMVARKTGSYDLELRYQLAVSRRGDEAGLVLPTGYGLVNQVKLTVANLDVEVLSPQAVSIRREAEGSNTVAALVLSPANNAWIAWKPRSRDVKLEKAVFYAELAQLFVPSAGVIAGAHMVSIRPAQGQLSELFLQVPTGVTITDVTDAKRGEAQAAEPLVSLWRFDPDARKLRVTLNPAQSRPFTLLVRSQLPVGPLPFEQTVGLISVENAAGQIGLLGVATGNEVQLDALLANSCSPINLEDFPAAVAASVQPPIPGLTLRRAFRYSDTKAVAALNTSPVEPDVRVETQDTVSLGEDRTVLAANATVTITRAGIFKLSFLMPEGFDVESITGQALSHWTESRDGTERVITLHLNGKTEGQQQFAISLAGPGVKAARAWNVPQLVLREAGKQRGGLVLVPEQGLRLQVDSAEGLTQLDPQKSGIKQKGVLAFRVLQAPRRLSLNLEQVDPWIQVTSLQHATVTEALVKIVANLQYQIENTGLKAFRVYLPTNAESVRFQGEQLADYLPVTGAATNGLQAWDVKLHRRVIGSYLLHVSYQTPLPPASSETVLRGVQAAEVNLQRGFVTVQSGGRLQLRLDATPEALQPAEWQSIPRALQQGLAGNTANFTYRLVEPGFALPLKLERHEAVKLLAARVNSVAFNSVISDDGVMLTQVRLEIQPGDKRLLGLTLPPGAQFWFAFVSQSGVWPWRLQNQILIPLEQPSRALEAIPVEFFYTCSVGASARQSLDLDLLAPKFDLPLENITWRVSLDHKWRLEKWSGTLQFQHDQVVPQVAAIDLQAYLQTEAAQKRERTREAENLLAVGNSALQQGDPQQARRSFQAAYGLSTHDAAFNEDARVQLHNLKLQQALVGLNVRQAASADTGALAGRLRELRGRKDANYTQQDANEIIQRSSEDDNAAFMRLAERLVQQQDAAVVAPAALRANLPEQGRVLTFKRAVVVDPWADLRVTLKASAAGGASSATRFLILGLAVVIMGAGAWASQSRRPA